jgi:hypothetical protein
MKRNNENLQYYSALGFYKQGNKLARKINKKIGNEQFELVSVSTVCYSFSTELLLKLLIHIVLKQAINNEHKLEKLFKKIPSEYQSKIEQKYRLKKIIKSEELKALKEFWKNKDFQVIFISAVQKIGIDTDNREAMYNAIKNMKMVDLRNFFNENIKGENYNVMVIGNERDIDFTALNTLGKVQKMDIDYLFNYEKPVEVKL